MWPRGIKRSEETRKKMSLAQMGNKKWLGKKHSEETKSKMRMAWERRPKSKPPLNCHGIPWTEERRIEWSKRKSGEGNNNWKGGVTPERKTVRKSWKYRLWSFAVRERDGKCKDCGSTENLHAHHIERFLINKEKQYDLDNGITLCSNCHYEYHKGDGAYAEAHLEKRANIA
jgi:5-methylcytosine-specific restriction endonuclease McrA